MLTLIVAGCSVVDKTSEDPRRRRGHQAGGVQPDCVAGLPLNVLFMFLFEFSIFDVPPPGF